MSNLPELPDELKILIISMVDDVDIRRYFGVYNKIDIRKYRRRYMDTDISVNYINKDGYAI